MNPRRSVPFLAVAVAAASLFTSLAGGSPAAAAAHDLPDPCTLLSRREVVQLTGRHITQIDEDDAEPGESTRYCQWQQDGGQLALFLTRTTKSGFTSQIGPDAEPVDGVGDDAFLLAGHLYVRDGRVQIDVYSYGADDAQNFADEKAVAVVVMSKV